MADVIQLSPEDNIVVLARGIAKGETIELGNGEVTASEALGLGHKLALRAIAPGEKILKYGAPIGSATHDIPRGGHVHLHNMKSDYLPTYTLEEGQVFGGLP